MILLYKECEHSNKTDFNDIHLSLMSMVVISNGYIYKSIMSPKVDE